MSVHVLTGLTLRLNYTVLACGNASGNVAPPIILFCGKLLWDAWCQKGPPGSLYNVTKNSWIAEQSFFQ